MRNFIANILTVFIPFKKIRHNIRNRIKCIPGTVYFSLRPYVNTGKNNRVIIIKDGKRRKLSKFEKIKGVNVVFSGNDNLIEIEYPFHPVNSIISVQSYYGVPGKNNKCYIGKNFSGSISVYFHTVDSVFKCGENCSIADLQCNLVHNSFYIGNDCLMSVNIVFQGDGHSVLDYETGRVLNKPKNIVEIGNHCWIGRDIKFLKGAKIPADCIVAAGSIVTKMFDKPHCVIAGSPAKVVKENISWHFQPPCYYDEFNFNKEYKKYL